MDEIVAEEPLPVVKEPPPRFLAEDPAEVEWMGVATARWEAAVLESPDEPMAAYAAPALPDFAAAAPVHVKREILGRFLEDRNTGTLHDVHAADEACAVDRIRNGTFYHFASEVPTTLAPCPFCIG